MTTSRYYIKQLTSAELGEAKTHEKYIRLTNDFPYEEFFQTAGYQNGTVTQIDFTAYNKENANEAISLKFIYYSNSNKEKRIPSIGNIFDARGVKVNDVVVLESVTTDGETKIYISFRTPDSISLSPSTIYYTIVNDEKPHKLTNGAQTLPLQQIYYGAPGTGKSHEINRLTEGCKDVFRTTFHPDSDYSTFVGAYKPIEDAVQRTYVWMNPTTGKAELLPVINTTGNANLDKESKISYKFVQQAFVKAYIRAWEKFSKVAESGNSNLLSDVVVTNGNSQWRVTRISGDQVSTVPVTPFSRTMQSVAACAINGTLDIPDTTKIDSDLWALCHWFCNGYSKDVNKLADNWADMKRRFDDGEQLVIEGAGYQKWEVQKIEDNKITLRAIKDTNSTKQELQSIFSNAKTGTGKNIAIVNYMKDILHASSFEDGWTKLEDAVQQPNHSYNGQHVDPVYLIIEEINRGNCAQIFGDLFQLLDRNDAGFSAYAINSDSDLAKELQKCLREVSLDETVKNYINSLYEVHYDDIVEKVLKGELLLLPNNLYIWATMNTSDQSLFPIDSAFKRRWDWQYIKIEDAGENYKILVNGHEYDWFKFLTAINKEILDLTHSEDKQLGYFFAKADAQGVIDAAKLVNKVYFYLWNDVFKDYETENNRVFKKADSNDSIAFKDFFATGQKIDEVVAEQVLINLKLNEPVAE